jgi:transposase-like protein
LKAGTTVDAVARLYGVHASQIYDWRKQHRQKMKQRSTALSAEERLAVLLKHRLLSPHIASYVLV